MKRTHLPPSSVRGNAQLRGLAFKICCSKSLALMTAGRTSFSDFKNDVKALLSEWPIRLFKTFQRFIKCGKVI